MTFALHRHFLVAVLLALIASGTYAQTNRPPSSIQFTDIQTAFKESARKKRVMVVYFTASWCGYCRKMKATTFVDDQIIELSRKFIWTQIDVDEQPRIASLFGVQGLPMTLVLNARGETLDRRAGYLSPKAMLALLQQYVDKAEAPGQQQQRSNQIQSSTSRLRDGEVSGKAIGELLALLADPAPQGRSKAKQAIIESGPRTWAGLVGALASPRLAVRAAAYSLLLETTRKIKDPKPRFDPFAAETKRRRQVDAWRQWVAKHTPDSTPLSPPKSTVAPVRKSRNAPLRPKPRTSPSNDQEPSDETPKEQPRKDN